MSDENTFTGEITITPLLTWAEIRRLPQLRDVGVRIDTSTTPTDTGEIVTKTAGAITAPREWGGEHIIDDVQQVVDLFGADHEFTGFIEAWWDPGYGPTAPDRFLVRDGRAVKVEAAIVWPGGDSDAAALARVRAAVAELRRQSESYSNEALSGGLAHAAIVIEQALAGEGAPNE